MTAKGSRTKLKTINNEASAALKKYFTEKEMNYQLVRPHCDRDNASERAIRTFKEHFKAGLATVDTDFSAHLWDRLLTQAEIALDLLRASQLHPQLSAAAHYHGLIDCNKTAFGPPGCKIIAHENRYKDAHGQHMGNPDGLLAPPCTIIGVKTSISLQQPVSKSLIHSNFSLTIRPCLKCCPLTASSWPRKI
jgi:hypothetical protein